MFIIFSSQRNCSVLVLDWFDDFLNSKTYTSFFFFRIFIRNQRLQKKVMKIYIQTFKKIRKQRTLVLEFPHFFISITHLSTVVTHIHITRGKVAYSDLKILPTDESDKFTRK